MSAQRQPVNIAQQQAQAAAQTVQRDAAAHRAHQYQQARAQAAARAQQQTQQRGMER